MDRTLDYVIIILYLVGVAIFGILSGGRQRTVKDYFLGTKSVPWWAVCFSIVAAETSTLTFISVPGLSYIANLNFLQVTFGYLLGRVVIAIFFLPSYFSGELSTAYAFLERRFGKTTRSYASIVFLFTRTAADGVRLFATAIPLKLMLDISYPAAIVIIAIVTLIYTSTGGVKGVIWVDVVQMFIYLGGALLAGYFLIYVYLPDGWQSLIDAANFGDKLEIINFGFGSGISEFFGEPYTLIGGIIGGAFLSMASHGTDQLIVQRLLTTRDLRASQKAIVGSGIIIIFQFAIFLLVGLALYAYFGQIDLKSDEIFPKFIIENLPVGFSGLIIAGLFAAAMSTIAGSISSLSSSTMLDLYQPLMGGKERGNELIISRVFTFIWAVLLVGAAIFFMESSRAVVELALSIASFTYGGLLGTFMLGLFIKRVEQKEALIAFSIGIGVMVIVVLFNLVAWTWYTLLGVLSTMISGYILSVFRRN